MTNEQLALALISAFRHFGPILSVKASRDSKGRPFGFVDFASPQSARDALAAAPSININFRQVRVEAARCQRKLMVKALVLDGDKLVAQMESLKKVLLQYTNEPDLKINAFNSPYESGETFIAAVLKFTDSTAADRAFKELTTMSQGWDINWLTNEREGSTGIRSSGLVHIIPSKLGPSAYYSIPLFMPTAFPPSSLEYISSAPVIPIGYDQQRRFEGPIFEERLVKSESDEEEICREFEEVSIKSDGNEKDITMRILEATIFAGRLNSQKISTDLLIEHFQKYGGVRYVCLFNRNAKTPEGVPLDAYSFITFECSNSARLCIAESNGSVWLGQTMKCEPARVLPSTPSVIQLYHKDSTLPN